MKSKTQNCASVSKHIRTHAHTPERGPQEKLLKHNKAKLSLKFEGCIHASGHSAWANMGICSFKILPLSTFLRLKTEEMAAISSSCKQCRDLLARFTET